MATWASSVAGVGGRLYVAALARYPAARLVEDNLVLNTGSRLVFECTPAPPGTCLVFGDSYSFDLLPFLAESFRRLVVATHPTVDWEVVGEEQPSVVITVIAERFLVNRQDPPDGSFARTARDKIAEKQVRARFDRWDGERSIAPFEFERHAGGADQRPVPSRTRCFWKESHMPGCGPWSCTGCDGRTSNRPASRSAARTAAGSGCCHPCGPTCWSGASKAM